MQGQHGFGIGLDCGQQVGGIAAYLFDLRSPVAWVRQTLSICNRCFIVLLHQKTMAPGLRE